MSTLLAHQGGLVSSLVFSPFQNRNILACTSWDKSVTLYDESNSAVLSHSDSRPILCCDFVEDSSICFAGISKTLSLLDINKNVSSKIGRHDAAIHRVKYHKGTNTVIAIGWDKTIRLYDLRANLLNAVLQANLHGKPCCMDLVKDTLVVADSAKRIYIYDLSAGLNAFETPKMRDNVLKYRYRSLSIFPDLKGFIVSSIEGRVAWELLDDSSDSKGNQYVFKCHRDKDTAEELIYSVDATSFHPNGTFVTGGADGVVCAWDGYTRKRLWKTSPFNAGVTAITYDPKGEKLAIATGNIYNMGQETIKPRVVIKTL